jgi:hypothetical protein
VQDRIKDASVISEAALQSALDLIKPGVALRLLTLLTLLTSETFDETVNMPCSERLVRLNSSHCKQFAVSFLQVFFSANFIGKATML